MRPCILNPFALLSSFKGLYTILILLVWCMNTSNTYSQTQKDSLWREWNNVKLPDTSRLKALSTFVFEHYLFSKTDSSYQYIKILRDFATKTDQKFYLADAYNLEGIANDLNGEFDEAIESYNKSLKIWTELDLKNSQANTYNNISIVYYNIGDYKKAIDYTNRSLRIKTELGDKIGIASCYNALGNICRDQGDLVSAINYLNKALKMNEEAGDKRGMAHNLTNIGIIYLDQEKDWEKAIENFLKSIEISKDFNNDYNIAVNWNNLGSAYLLKGNVIKAEEATLKSLAITESIDNFLELPGDYINLGEIYLIKKEFDQAFKYYKLSDSIAKKNNQRKFSCEALLGLSNVSLKIAESVNEADNSILFNQKNNDATNFAIEALELAKEMNIIREMSSAYYYLYSAYSNKGDYETALVNYELHSIMKDSLLKEENRKAIIKQDYKLKYNEQLAANRAESAEEIKAEKSIRIYLYIGLAILIVFIGLMYIRYKELQQQRKTIENTLSELKHAQKQLVEAEKMAALGVLTAGIAHEINNPVNFISNGLNILKNSFNHMSTLADEFMELSEDSNDFKEKIKSLQKNIKDSDIEEEIEDTLEFMVVGVKRTTDIIQGLSLYARSEKSKIEKANIHKIIDSALVLLNNKFKGRIKIEKKYDNTIKKFSCYPSQLNQVFINLLGNSMDAIPEKGTITIKTLLKDDTIVVSIRDTGIGIKEDIKDKIFDPFYTTKDVGKGTGLGLSICQGIINNHKGTMTFSSKLNEGTEFVIKLPLELKND